ncbi:MAG: hypothetical protein J2P21_02085 [Chloracidobacterium sp.]|nr:hypothetical protein [Chloracidobacterium sp.]
MSRLESINAPVPFAAFIAATVPFAAFIGDNDEYGVPAGLSGLARHFFESPSLKKGLALPPDFKLILLGPIFPKKGAFYGLSELRESQ